MQRSVTSSPLLTIAQQEQESHLAVSRGLPARGVRVQAYADTQKEQVWALYATVFGETAACAFQARWQWSQEENLYPDQSPKWVLLDGEQVVGFLATMPLPYSIDGVTIVAQTPCDYMVHPDYRFHGIKLMQAFFASRADCVTCDDMPATIGVTKWLGAQTVGTLVRYVKVLDGRALGLRDRWSTVPSFGWWPLTQLLRARDITRGWSGAHRGAVQSVPDFDPRFERLARRLVQWVPVTLVRDLRFLQWRYGKDSPHADREIGVVTDRSGELAGYVTFSLSQGGSHAGYILDLQTFLPDNKKVAADLLTYAAERLRRRGAWTVRYHHVSSPYGVTDAVLKERGFIARGGHRLMVRLRDARAMAIAGLQENWSYSYGDSEASHASI